MAGYKPWFEQLKDPRWQRKRLEIMQRDRFECINCGDKDTTLNVHHAYYEKELAPWEYPDESLQCLCENCHLKAKECHEKLMFSLRTLGTAGKDMARGYVDGLRIYDADLFEKEGFEVLIDSAEQMMGLAECWRVHEDYIWHYAETRDKKIYVSHDTYTKVDTAYREDQIIYNPSRRHNDSDEMFMDMLRKLDKRREMEM